MCNVYAIVYKLSRGCKNNDPRKKVDTKSVNDSKFLQNAKIGRKIKKRDKVQNTANFEAFSFFCHPKLLLERHGVLLSLSLPLNKSCHSSQILLLPFKNACEQYQKEPGYLKVT